MGFLVQTNQILYKRNICTNFLPISTSAVSIVLLTTDRGMNIARSTYNLISTQNMLGAKANILTTYKRNFLKEGIQKMEIYVHRDCTVPKKVPILNNLKYGIWFLIENRLNINFFRSIIQSPIMKSPKSLIEMSSKNNKWAI